MNLNNTANLRFYGVASLKVTETYAVYARYCEVFELS